MSKEPKLVQQSVIGVSKEAPASLGIAFQASPSQQLKKEDMKEEQKQQEKEKKEIKQEWLQRTPQQKAYRRIDEQLLQKSPDHFTMQEAQPSIGLEGRRNAKKELKHKPMQQELLRQREEEKDPTQLRHKPEVKQTRDLGIQQSDEVQLQKRLRYRDLEQFTFFDPSYRAMQQEQAKKIKSEIKPSEEYLSFHEKQNEEIQTEQKQLQLEKDLEQRQQQIEMKYQHQLQQQMLLEKQREQQEAKLRQKIKEDYEKEKIEQDKMISALELKTKEKLTQMQYEQKWAEERLRQEKTQLEKKLLEESRQQHMQDMKNIEEEQKKNAVLIQELKITQMRLSQEKEEWIKELDKQRQQQENMHNIKIAEVENKVGYYEKRIQFLERESSEKEFLLQEKQKKEDQLFKEMKEKTYLLQQEKEKREKLEREFRIKEQQLNQQIKDYNLKYEEQKLQKQNIQYELNQKEEQLKKVEHLLKQERLERQKQDERRQNEERRQEIQRYINEIKRQELREVVKERKEEEQRRQTEQLLFQESQQKMEEEKLGQYFEEYQLEKDKQKELESDLNEINKRDEYEWQEDEKLKQEEEEIQKDVQEHGRRISELERISQDLIKEQEALLHDEEEIEEQILDLDQEDKNELQFLDQQIAQKGLVSSKDLQKIEKYLDQEPTNIDIPTLVPAQQEEEDLIAFAQIERRQVQHKLHPESILVQEQPTQIQLQGSLEEQQDAINKMKETSEHVELQPFEEVKEVEQEGIILKSVHAFTRPVEKIVSALRGVSSSEKQEQQQPEEIKPKQLKRQDTDELFGVKEIDQKAEEAKDEEILQRVEEARQVMLKETNQYEQPKRKQDTQQPIKVLSSVPEICQEEVEESYDRNKEYEKSKSQDKQDLTKEQTRDKDMISKYVCEGLQRLSAAEELDLMREEDTRQKDLQSKEMKASQIQKEQNHKSPETKVQKGVTQLHINLYQVVFDLKQHALSPRELQFDKGMYAQNQESEEGISSFEQYKSLPDEQYQDALDYPVVYEKQPEVQIKQQEQKIEKVEEKQPKEPLFKDEKLVNKPHVHKHKHIQTKGHFYPIKSNQSKTSKDEEEKMKGQYSQPRQSQQAMKKQLSSSSGELKQCKHGHIIKKPQSENPEEGKDTQNAYIQQYHYNTAPPAHEPKQLTQGMLQMSGFQKQGKMTGQEEKRHEETQQDNNVKYDGSQLYVKQRTFDMDTEPQILDLGRKKKKHIHLQDDKYSSRSDRIQNICRKHQMLLQNQKINSPMSDPVSYQTHNLQQQSVKSPLIREEKQELDQQRLRNEKILKYYEQQQEEKKSPKQIVVREYKEVGEEDKRDEKDQMSREYKGLRNAKDQQHEQQPHKKEEVKEEVKIIQVDEQHAKEQPKQAKQKDIQPPQQPKKKGGIGQFFKQCCGINKPKTGQNKKDTEQKTKVPEKKVPSGTHQLQVKEMSTKKEPKEVKEHKEQESINMSDLIDSQNKEEQEIIKQQPKDVQETLLKPQQYEQKQILIEEERPIYKEEDQPIYKQEEKQEQKDIQAEQEVSAFEDQPIQVKEKVWSDDIRVPDSPSRGDEEQEVAEEDGIQAIKQAKEQEYQLREKDDIDIYEQDFPSHQEEVVEVVEAEGERQKIK